jgi:DNA polymerase-3 subunit epsilon
MNFKQKPLFFVDIETTGPKSTSDSILEIAVLKTVDNVVVDKFETLLDPKRPIPYFIQNFTGIKPAMVVGMPSFAEIARDLYEFLADGVFVAHNVSFDYNFLRNEFTKAGIDWQMPRLCTVKLSRKMFPLERKHNLDSVIERIGVKIENRHRALDDCQVLVELMQHLQDNHCPIELDKQLQSLLSN